MNEQHSMCSHLSAVFLALVEQKVSVFAGISMHTIEASKPLLAKNTTVKILCDECDEFLECEGFDNTEKKQKCYR